MKRARDEEREAMEFLSARPGKTRRAHMNQRRDQALRAALLTSMAAWITYHSNKGF
jgi:hypothetical protein